MVENEAGVGDGFSGEWEIWAPGVYYIKQLSNNERTLAHVLEPKNQQARPLLKCLPTLGGQQQDLKK